MYLVLVAQKAIEAYEISQKNQARYIINYLAQALDTKKTSAVQRNN
jgi:hypothetical protein